ncbi:hypothetical protein HBE96_13470 [Clostridium sp. P21]|uniref:Uncharacterized protein n=1 Tax=Clostridium muellerianum TaxID=2716538 RepID=A0A7Y0EHN4_9CLOT|nr:hypothetical protein [Clostridium muellerianum]NMM63664.1 hypothetical protein [Clostridium muellerianum]
MEDILESFAEEYSLNADRKIFEGDAQRSANNPILFLFIGEGAKDASKHISSNIRCNWDNGKAIVFMNVLKEKVEDDDNVFNFQIEYSDLDKKSLRKNIRDNFYSDKKMLACLNEKITMVRDKILSSGKLFNSFENINIAVVTTSDDPLNIILPEITMLVKKRMLEVFKLGIADLYILIKEKDVEDEFLSEAMSMSFFRELEYVQKKLFIFKEKIEIYGEERELLVEAKGPVFYLTYILEEKNEKGLIPERSMENNYNIIGYINLLKNRNVSIETYSDTENQYYDNTRFKANISLEDSLNRYVSAGLAVVKRPNKAIAITVVRAFYENFIKRLKEFSKKDEEAVVSILKLDEDNVALNIERILPKAVTIYDMNSIMMNNTKSLEKRLSKLNLRQIEEELYRDRCENFFNNNFIEYADKKLNDINFENEFSVLFEKSVLNNDKLGLYCALNWSEGESIVFKYIKKEKKILSNSIEGLRKEIENTYESRFVEEFSLKNIFTRGKNIDKVKEKLFTEVYGRKLNILRLNIFIKILEKYEAALNSIHKEIYKYIEKTKNIHSIILKYEDEIVRKQQSYTGQNIKVYYTKVVNNILENLINKYGEDFYFGEEYFGNSSEIIKRTQEDFILKLIEFCNKYILPQPDFIKSFEEELSERANVDTGNLENKVLSKDEIYRKLYDILGENSALKIYIMNYDVRSYAEKYFFGDYSSNFIKYAFDFDRKVRNYKIGYVHEKRISGIENLNLMGGFAAKDIFYIRNSIDKYEACLKCGYEFHGIDVSKLPEIK